MKPKPPTRDDLYAAYWFEEGPRKGTHEFAKPSDADLAAMGLVQAPECGECGGSGNCVHDVVGEHGGDEHLRPCPGGPCPKCGGSGYGRLVSLDVDDLERLTVEDGGSKPDPWTGEAIQAEPIIRGKAIEGCRTYLPLGDYFLVPNRQVLAALDGGDARSDDKPDMGDKIEVMRRSYLTPEQFDALARSQGYIKLDVDVEALREAVAYSEETFDTGNLDYLTESNPIWKVARQVLAGLDEETT